MKLNILDSGKNKVGEMNLPVQFAEDVRPDLILRAVLAIQSHKRQPYGGSRAHPPKTEKIWWQKINEKERSKAIRSAISATVIKETVAERGHSVPDNYPFIIDDKFESFDKTKSVLDSLKKLGLESELERVESKKVRAGKGKLRGRKYTQKKGPLIVVSKKDNLTAAASNIPGVDIVEVKSLNAELLAPGGKAGRLTLWTQAAINILEKEKLFK